MLRVGFGGHFSAPSILVDQLSDAEQIGQSTCHHHEACHCQFIPPHIQKHIAESNSEVVRDHLETIAEHLLTTRRFRQLRTDWEQHHEATHHTANTSGSEPTITIYNAKNGTSLPGKKLTSEKILKDVSANQALIGAQNTYRFYKEILGRDSIDNRHMAIVSTVHYDKNYDNAFWDGKQMVYGDGDKKIFGDFTGDPDVIGHELSHGVTQYTGNLEYHNQSGALNEHFSDVMGTCIKQWSKKQTVDKADWLIGDKVLLGPGALRSMKNPGEAYNTPLLGKDEQPATMDNYKQMPDNDDNDNGGVHINSGIPNHAFYLVCMALGGHSYDKAVKIWYDTMTNQRIKPTANFAQFAKLTEKSAMILYGADSAADKAVKTAWRQVKVIS